MKNYLRTVALTIGISSSFLAVQAQRVIIEDDEPNSIMFVSRDKAGDDIIRIMKETQSPRFQDPQAPRFLLTDQKRRFALGIGGYVRAVGEYDFGGIVKDVDFYPSLIPSGGTDYARNQFQMDITTSTIFLKLVGKTKRLGNFVVYTAGNFRGDGYTFQLQNAYASFLGFTLGYDYGSFMDLAAIPATIDFAGPAGMSIYHATQIRYEHKFKSGIKFGIGVEMPTVEGIVNNHQTINTQRMPNFPAYVQYGWKGGSHFRVGAIVRSMTYSDQVTQKAKSQTGWGVQASTILHFTPNFQLLGQATYGKGIGSLMNDLSNLNVDLVPNPEKEGTMQALPMMGWYAGLQYNFSPQVFISSTYSQSRLYSEKDFSTQYPTMYKYGQYLVANVFWNVTSNLQVGAEYLRGWKKDFTEHKEDANRVNAIVQYSF